MTLAGPPSTRTALVTGAEGFTGRYMVAELERLNYSVHGLARAVVPPDNGTAGGRGADVKLHACDLLDSAGLRAIVAKVRPDKVIHLAGVSSVAGNDPETIYRTNLLGTRVLLEALSASTTRPSAVLLASSANVYGNATEGVMHEDTPPAPANDYAVSKLAMEYLAHTYDSQLPCVICRPFNYTGVGQAERFLLPKIVEHARRRAPVIELGNMDVARDFSDVRTVVQAYAALLEASQAIGRTFNVCSGRAYALDEVLSIVEGLSGHRFEVRVSPALVRRNEVKMLLGSRDRLDACIGTQPVHALRTTLAWMLQ